MKLLGWDEEQWAIALARYQITDLTVKSALKVKHEWMKKWPNEPGEIQILGEKPEKNYDDAFNLFMQVGV